MADLQKRGGYTPRRAREQRAFRLVTVGGTSGALGLLLAVLAIAGVVSWFPAILLICVAVACGFMFRGMTS